MIKEIEIPEDAAASGYAIEFREKLTTDWGTWRSAHVVHDVSKEYLSYSMAQVDFKTVVDEIEERLKKEVEDDASDERMKRKRLKSKPVQVRIISCANDKIMRMVEITPPPLKKSVFVSEPVDIIITSHLAIYSKDDDGENKLLGELQPGTIVSGHRIANMTVYSFEFNNRTVYVNANHASLANQPKVGSDDDDSDDEDRR